MEVNKKLANKKSEQRTEADWQAIWDARTLADAEIIKGDEKRYAFAKEWAAVLVAEEKAEASAMTNVANG